jgi:hypothetical protein
MSFKSSLQRDLDRFYKVLFNKDFNIREVTKGALSQARAKLNPWAFKRLNEVASESFYRNAEYYTWYGLRLLSVDGSRLLLPSHPSTKDKFGEHGFGPTGDSNRSLAMVSMLYDALNHLTIDAEIAPYASSERDLLMRHLSKVKKGDILLLDRGYPCFWLLFLLKAKGIEFCVRLKDNWWLEVKEFVKSEDRERIVKFRLPKKDRDKLEGYPQICEEEISCRLIKVELSNGEIEILCTSLTDFEKYDVEEFKKLYHYRWNEEEAYKLLKCRAELEKFSGKTAWAVEQDFHAKIFMMTMCAAYAHPIEEKVRAEYQAGKDRKHPQKINRTYALATFMDMSILIFIKRKFEEGLKAFDELVYKTREIIRPNRTVPRKKKPKRPYHMNVKPL